MLLRVLVCLFRVFERVFAFCFCVFALLCFVVRVLLRHCVVALVCVIACLGVGAFVRFPFAWFCVCVFFCVCVRVVCGSVHVSLCHVYLRICPLCVSLCVFVRVRAGVCF